MNYQGCQKPLRFAVNLCLDLGMVCQRHLCLLNNEAEQGVPGTLVFYIESLQAVPEALVFYSESLPVT